MKIVRESLCENIEAEDELDGTGVNERKGEGAGGAGRGSKRARKVILTLEWYRSSRLNSCLS